ncbi:hypothetical protein E2562_000898 [Oryza meyeriana var. granulata]|uniref:Uncharacterized protein n=1 Tax=Oryza meyeriana var. granulata TaxID=110450 RepID=A0A6G1CWX3_9ORYZ|nr:hypothetical protein E2562_000898 [Oryza meyeriana var. granulata]
MERQRVPGDPDEVVWTVQVEASSKDLAEKPRPGGSRGDLRSGEEAEANGAGSSYSFPLLINTQKELEYWREEKVMKPD